MTNPAKDALTRAVNNAIASGAPIYENLPAPRPLYQAIASALAAADNCRRSGNVEWRARHIERAESLAREYLPSGSGFDAGTIVDVEVSTADRLVFVTSFHHMTESGFYAGWTEHKVIATPSFVHGLALRITGRDRNQIKDYIADVFGDALRHNVAA